MRWLAITVALSIFSVEILANTEIHVRAKRQQCKCVRNPGGGLTCSCGKPDVTPGSNLATAEYQQQNELAQELQTGQATQARCACLQIVFMGNPQYQCHCGDINGNPLPTTTIAPYTTPQPTTTTTPSTTTTTTTLPPTTTTYAQQPIQTTTVGGTGQCQCIMIRISGPSSAHYQCNCQNTPEPYTDTTILPTPPPLATLPPVASTPPTPPPLPPVTQPPYTLPPVTPPPTYPAVGTINSTQPGCFCVDPVTHGIEPQCGCQCDCVLQLCTMPMAVCACPQDQFGVPVAQNPMMTTMPPIPTLPPTTLPPMTLPPAQTQTPGTLPPVTFPPSTYAPVPDTTQQESAYPLTTTCVMYVGVQATPCTCLPQYDQCAQNICCLKAKYRNYKNNPVYHDSTEPSTIDVLMNMLQKLKNRLQ